MTVMHLGMGGGERRPLMKPSERLDALKPSLEREAENAEVIRHQQRTDVEQLERAEEALRTDAMFSGPQRTEFFGLDVPRADGDVLWYGGDDEMVESRIVEITHDPMPIDGWYEDGEEDRQARVLGWVVWSVVALCFCAAMVVAFAW